MLKISFAGCLGLSPAILSQFNTLKCVLQSKTAENSSKTPLLEFQGRSRSSMFINLKILSVVLVMKSSACLYLSATVFTVQEPIAAT